MIYVFLADGFEEIEALTPVDFLRRCDLPVCTVGVTGKEVKGSHGIVVKADCLPEEINVSDVQMIVLPGGMPGTLNLEKSQAVQEMISYCVEHVIPIGAICAAPSILGHRSLLAGKRATCFFFFESELIGAEVTGAPVEVDGMFITARGAGVANTFAFALAALLLGDARAQALKDSLLCEK